MIEKQNELKGYNFLAAVNVVKKLFNFLTSDVRLQNSQNTLSKLNLL